MKKIFLVLIFLLAIAPVFAALDQTFTFSGTANDTADPLPATGTLGFIPRYICVHNLSATDSIWVKPCDSSTCVADATAAGCTDGTGCNQWIVPAGASYCYATLDVKALSTDTAAGKTVAYVITAGR